MTLLIILVAVNVGAWCWLAATAATQLEIDGHDLDRTRPFSTRH